MKVWLSLVVFLVSSVLLVIEMFERARYAPPIDSREVRIEELTLRAEHISMTLSEIEDTYYDQIRPVYADLISTTRVQDTQDALLTAVFINKFARAEGLNPLLVSAIVKVENPWLVHDTVSFAGALGIMQVMPSIWSDEFPECGEDLSKLDTNVCTGVKILSRYMNSELDRALDRTLLRYNGCVSTPGCEVYTRKVLSDSDIQPFMN